MVRVVGRFGFLNALEVEPLLMAGNENVYFEFTSANVHPVAGELVGFDGQSISLLDDLLASKSFKVSIIDRIRFEAIKEAGGV